MQRLSDTPELLDGPLDGVLLAGNLRDLARVNRWLGGAALSRLALLKLHGDGGCGSNRELRVLDVGTGAADIPAALITWGREHGLPLTFVAVDQREEIVAAARERVGDRPELRLETISGAVLPYPDDAFDVAHASLVLHHLEPAAAGALLAEMSRVGRCGVIVNDLDRTRPYLLGAWLLSHLLSANRYTRTDAPLSVRRAYRPAEVARLAADVGLIERRRIHGFLRHRYAIVLVRRPVADASAPDGR